MRLPYNPILANDSYKLDHGSQTPGDTSYTYSHLTPRFLKYLKRKFPTMSDKVIVFGNQATIQLLAERWQKDFFDVPWNDVEEDSLAVLAPFAGYTPDNLLRFKALHELGYLPLKFKGIDEGSWVNINIPTLTLTNTHPAFGWLPNFIEPPILNAIFKPMTVATLTLEIARLRDRFFNETVVDVSGKDFAWHDFSYRGQSSHDSAAFAVMGYLLYTKGTDTLAAVKAAKYYYGATDAVAGSIPAFEHSTATTGIQYFKGILQTFESYCKTANQEVAIQKLATQYKLKMDTVRKGLQVAQNVKHMMAGESEKDIMLAVGEAFNLVRVLLEVYPTGLFAYVSDSYDYQRMVSIIVYALKDIINERDGKFIVRPDSGNPVDIVTGTDADIKDIVARQIAAGKYGVGMSFTIDNVDYRIEKSLPKQLRENTYLPFSELLRQDIVILGPRSTEYRVVCPAEKGTVQVFHEIFGSEENDKNYYVLNPHIGLVYGDGINYERAEAIYTRLKDAKFAASNICLAAGAFMLANLTRDDLGFAIKASNTVVDGVSIPVYKEPKTDSAKTSAKGLFKVVKEGGEYRLIDDVTPEEEATGELKEFWVDGKFTKRVTLEEIQARLPL